MRRSVSQPVLLSVVTSLAIMRLGYSSATLSGVRGYLLNRLQSVLSAAVRLVCHAQKYDPVTHLLRDLHWLRVPVRIHFRLAVLVLCCHHNMAPPYLARDLRWTDQAESLQCLRSVYRQRTRPRAIGDRSFLPCDCEEYARYCCQDSVRLSIRPSVCQTRVL